MDFEPTTPIRYFFLSSIASAEWPTSMKAPVASRAKGVERHETLFIIMELNLCQKYNYSCKLLPSHLNFSIPPSTFIFRLPDCSDVRIRPSLASCHTVPTFAFVLRLQLQLAIPFRSTLAFVLRLQLAILFQLNVRIPRS